MSPTYRAILFDLDGTLVDTIGLILSSYRHTMAEHLGQVPPDEEWLFTLGRPLRIQLQKFAGSQEQLDSMFSTYLEHNQANYEQLVRSFPGMRDAIGTLKRAGYLLGVVTSKIRPNTDRELAAVGLADFFDTTITADDVANPKPHPEPVLIAAKRLGCEPGQTLFVGDSVFDLQAGRAAGAHTAAALWGPFDRRHLASERPDYWLERIDSLLSLLGLTSGDSYGK